MDEKGSSDKILSFKKQKQINYIVLKSNFVCYFKTSITLKKIVNKIVKLELFIYSWIKQGYVS